MLISIAAVLVGLAVLVWSADRFVDGAAAIAHHLGVSNLIIGITIIGFGTSAPEIAVSIIAVLEEVPGIAIGNAIGSNIANIGLILGVTALLAPIPVARGLMRKEFPLLAIATAVLVACLYDLWLGWYEGIILVSLLAATLTYMVYLHRHGGVVDAAMAAELEEIVAEEIIGEDDEDEEPMSSRAAWLWVVLGLVLLVASSRALVWGASNIATSLGISDLVIGLTIVALGTSLPELAASIASLKKSVPDLAVGNIIGSNLFNSLAVVGIPPLLGGFAVDSAALYRDLPVMVGLTLALFVMSWGLRGGTATLARGKGILLTLTFVGYQYYLYHQVVYGTPQWFG